MLNLYAIFQYLKGVNFISPHKVVGLEPICQSCLVFEKKYSSENLSLKGSHFECI